MHRTCFALDKVIIKFPGPLSNESPSINEYWDTPSPSLRATKMIEHPWAFHLTALEKREKDSQVSSRLGAFN